MFSLFLKIKKRHVFNRAGRGCGGGGRGGGGERGGLGRPEAGAHSARVSLKMVGCGPSFLALLSFLLPLINISQASLMTRIGLRLGGKHNSVSHQVLNCSKGGGKKKFKLSPQVGTHRSRVPWAVRIQREEEQEEWGKKVRHRCILMQ